MMLSTQSGLSALRAWVYPPEARLVTAEQRGELWYRLQIWHRMRTDEANWYHQFNAFPDAIKRTPAGARCAAALAKFRQTDNFILGILQPLKAVARDRGYLDAAFEPLVQAPLSWDYPGESKGTIAGLGVVIESWVLIVVWFIGLAIVAILGYLYGNAKAGAEVQDSLKDMYQTHVDAGGDPNKYPAAAQRDPVVALAEEGTNIAGLAVLGLGLYVAMRLLGRAR